MSSSVLAATVLGGDGADDIRGSLGGIAAGAYAGLALDGGRGGDTIDAAFDGLLDGALALAVAGGLDNDTLSADLQVAAGSTGYLAAAVLGGAGDDDLALTIADDSGGGGASALEFLFAVLDGGAGTDTCDASDEVEVINCEA